MANVNVFDAAGKQVRTYSFGEGFLPETPNTHLMHLHVLRQLANKRQGSASTLTRSEVRGGGKKPWKQKGTGRARAGSIRSPLWKGGGVIFGPKPRKYTMNLTVKSRRVALRSAILADLGATLLPRAPFQDDLARGAMAAWPVQDPAVTRRVILCSSRNIPLTNAAAAIGRLVREVTEDLCARGAWPGARLAA